MAHPHQHSTACHDRTGTAPRHDAHHVNYVKIWGILLALLVVSVAGPFARRSKVGHADHRVRHRDREGVHRRHELHAPEHREEVRRLPDVHDARVHAAVLRRRVARRDEARRPQLGERRCQAGDRARADRRAHAASTAGTDGTARTTAPDGAAHGSHQARSCTSAARCRPRAGVRSLRTACSAC